MSIYVLRLERSKFWVGYSNDPVRRLKQFLNMNEWVAHYEPESIYKVIPARKYRLDTEVKEMMVEFGIDNVRGGSWSESILPNAVLQTLRSELFGDSDIICFMCRKVGHYVQDCPDDDSGDTVSEFFGPTAEPSPALRPATPHPRSVTPLIIN